MPSRDRESLAGLLLVATPDLADGNFAHAVVLMLEHGPEGALGVILNRPRNIEVGALMPHWHDLAAPPSVLFSGGPVQADEAVIAVGRSSRPAQPVPELDGLGVVDLGIDPEAQEDLCAVRLFVGFAGWGAGQLEAELEAGGWFVVEAEIDDVLTTRPERMWRGVLERQGGMFTTVPEDPTRN